MANTNVISGLGKFPWDGGASGLVARLIDHDGPSSYSTGGEAITAASLGFKRIAFVQSMASNSGTYFTVPLIAAKKMTTSFKLMWFVAADGAEAAAAADLDAEATKLLVVGLP